jgi:hypothetical protein
VVVLGATAADLPRSTRRGVESGTHHIQIDNLPGCTVGDVYVAGSLVGHGPLTAAVHGSTKQTFTIFVDVDCE